MALASDWTDPDRQVSVPLGLLEDDHVLAREHVHAHALDDHLDEPDAAEWLVRHGSDSSAGYSRTRRTTPSAVSRYATGGPSATEVTDERANVVERARPRAVRRGASHWRTKAPSARWKAMIRSFAAS